MAMPPAGSQPDISRPLGKILLLLLFIKNFLFVGIIQDLKILQIVFRPKKLIKANYKLSKVKVLKDEALKDTFQQSFKFYNYWEGKKMHNCVYTSGNTHARTNTHISACTHKLTYADTHMHVYSQKRNHIHIDREKSTAAKTKFI